MKKIILTLFSIIAILGIVFFQDIKSLVFQPTKSSIPTGTTTSSPTPPDSIDQPIQTIATNLNIPWELVFLPDQTLLVTQRPGSLVRIFPDKKETIDISGVAHVGEGGLQGLALDPDFQSNQFIYLYLTTQKEDQLINRVEKYFFNLEQNSLSQKQIIIDQIPGARYHDGGRIKFGPDGYLYITTGDAGNTSSAQDTSSLSGKILRINKDGSIPADNPFNNPVYSYGHRNPQGIAWDSQDRLWSTEHGPSGIQTGNDEVNLIKISQNYGWPTIKGQQTNEGMVPPTIESGVDDTWAPAGMEIVNDSIYFTGLRGVALYQADIQAESLINLVAHFKNDFGRLRFVKVGPDGWLYLGTSNTDGRGEPTQTDDRIIKIHPSILKN